MQGGKGFTCDTATATGSSNLALLLSTGVRATAIEEKPDWNKRDCIFDRAPEPRLQRIPANDQRPRPARKPKLREKRKVR